VSSIGTTSGAVPPFHELVEHALVGVYVVQDDRLLYANPEMARLFGYPVNELLALPSIYGLVAEADRGTVQEMLRRRLEGEVTTVRYSMRGRRRDGSTIDLEVLSRRIDYAGRPAVSGTMVDVTERCRRERALEERESRLRALLDNALDAVFTCDLEGRFTSMNRSGDELFEFASREAIGRSLLEALAPEWHAQARAFLNDARTAPRALAKEVPIVTPRGAHRMVALSLQVVAREGADAEILGIARDVTARKRHEAALRTMTLIDELTGLYNRRGFMLLAERHLKLAIRKKKNVSLLFCDVDGLKKINDTFGHREGDRALIDAGDVLRRTFRSVDIIARLGGDEFTVFPLEAADDSGVVLTQRLEENLRLHHEETGRPYQLSMSVGIARFEAGGEWTIEKLLEEADRRLYTHKRQRRASPPPHDENSRSQSESEQEP
jgi:diguanylate cyclase (GGDEF)-like protein/PAS domain S-box-containing protein